MKIGKFSRKNNISVDAIRHYMDLELLLPQKEGGQYDFDRTCQEQLDKVVELKGMGFTLQEIKEIMIYHRLCHLDHIEENRNNKMLYENKKKEIEDKINELQLIDNKLDIKLNELNKYEGVEGCTLGLDLHVIQLLRCPTCRGSLSVNEGTIKDHQVIEGKLKCECGAMYNVERGILRICEDRDIKEQAILKGKHYIDEYINETHPAYLASISVGINWLNKKISEMSLTKKVILDLGSGVGFALRNYLELLPDDCIYLAIDRDLSRHHFLKSMLEKTGIKKSIIFIHADFLQLPLNYHSVDVLVDFSGTSNYSFEHEEFLLDLMEAYCKEHIRVLGSYILFNKFVMDNKIEPKYRHNFIWEHIENKIHSLGLETVDERTSKILKQGGKYEDFFVEGEEVYFHTIDAKR